MRYIYVIIVAIFFSMTAIPQVPENLESELVLLNVNTGQEKVILREKRHFEAPNWSPDGNSIAFVRYIAQ